MPDRARRPRLGTFVVAIAVLIAAPLAVVASDAFTDVPESNVHHDDITWLATNGITLGCNPPANTEFCPGDPVLRQQMASFMRRLAENQVVDAATALEANNATTADSATTADDADTLDGSDSSALVDPVSIVAGGSATSTGDDDFAFEDVPDASTTITVPEGQTAMIHARFTAESMCSGTSYASVRLVLDGTEMEPAVGNDFSFDSSDGGTETVGSWESHSVERFATDVGAGTYTVTAQRGSNCTSFRLDDWTLTVEANLQGTASLATLSTDDQ